MRIKKRICFITGTRADYGIYKPIFQLAKKSLLIDICIIVTGMHLEKKFGFTYKEIEKDKYKTYKIKVSQVKNNMYLNVGEEIIKIGDYLNKKRPDLLVVLGDRGEALAGAIVANYLNIPVVHIHGGEVSGHVDGVIRHAITKLSHLHFTATKKAKDRIIKMGEESWRVINSGAPGLDSIISRRNTDKKKLYNKYKINQNKKLILLVQHPVLSELSQVKNQIKETLLALKEINEQIIIIYPNSDSGSEEIIREIENYKNKNVIGKYKSIPHCDYLGLLKIANLTIGNSSSGIIEAAMFKTSVVDIGTRQENREYSENVIHVGYNHIEIIKAIKMMLNRDKQYYKKIKNPYGNGGASSIIIKKLENIDLNKLKNKKITY